MSTAQDYALTNNNGQFLLVHNGLNDQRIRITMIGYDDWEKIIAKNDTVVLVNLSRKALTLTVKLYDSDNSWPGCRGSCEYLCPQHHAEQTERCCRYSSIRREC